MNRNAADYYVEPSTESSIKDTNAVIAHIKGLDANSSSPEPLVQPILTPRFAISCTDELLDQLGKLAASDPKLRIQTHISENLSEISFTKELFSERSSYAQVYDHFGLLRDNTILAHAVHLEDEEKHLIRERRAGISHCPTSNFNLSSGVAPVGEYLDLGIKVWFVTHDLDAQGLNDHRLGSEQTYPEDSPRQSCKLSRRQALLPKSRLCSLVEHSLPALSIPTVNSR
jgi:guanine deaminase